MVNVIYQRNTLASCPPKCPMHGVIRRIMNAAKLITLKQEVLDNSSTCAMWYIPHDFPFHSFLQHPENHSSCRLFQQPQKKTDSTTSARLCSEFFFPSGKGKSWCNSPAGAAQHGNGGHLDQSHGTRVEILGAQGAKHQWLGKEMQPIGR